MFLRLGEITLADFKKVFDRPGPYRYHFKALDPEFGTVKEEVSSLQHTLANCSVVILDAEFIMDGMGWSPIYSNRSDYERIGVDSNDFRPTSDNRKLVVDFGSYGLQFVKKT